MIPVLADKDNHVIDALRYSIEPMRIAMAAQGLSDVYAREAAEAAESERQVREAAQAASSFAEGSMEAFMAAHG